jgi:hypothetical protein
MAAINLNLSDPPSTFDAAYAELIAIADRLRPEAGQTPPIDEIEPILRRSKILKSYCEDRIAKVKTLLDEG